MSQFLLGRTGISALRASVACVSNARLHVLMAAVIVSGICSTALAFPPADGDLDSTFGATGPGYTIVDFGNGADANQDGAHRMLRQPDGKFVAVGSVDNGSGNQVIGLARILNDGQLDTSFGDAATPGRFRTGGGFYNRTGNGVAVLPSGQLVVAGTIFYAPLARGELFFPINNAPNATETYFQWLDGSAFNDILALADGRLLVGGTAPGLSSTGDFALILYDGAGGFIESLTVPFNAGGSNDDQVQRIAFMPAANAVSGRIGYVYAIGSVALPNYASGHPNIECGVVKAGLYSAAPRLRLETSFGTANSGKLVLDVNAGWLAFYTHGIDGNAYCRGITVRKDGGLLIAGERYYFGYDNSHATADNSVGFAAKLDANGVADATFQNGFNSGGFTFYWRYFIDTANALYQGLWFSLIQSDGLPLFGGLTEVDCNSGGSSNPRNRTSVLRTTATGSQDATYSPYFCASPRPAADNGFDVALDGVFDAGEVVTVGNVFSSLSPASATDFVFMRHYSDLIFTDNFDPGY